MEITDLLCHDLQRKSQDICNALSLVTSTKVLLQKMKNERWDDLLSCVTTFCQKLKIEIPDLSSSYSSRDYKQLKSISELCQWLIKTRRAANFHLIYRLATLILTLLVSTATTERSFSAMSLVKTRLRNKMEDEFLNDSLVLYFERELAEKISLETIVEDFKLAKDRRIPL
ncbi:hypothetical protein LXL04_002391 [Taraxacum kok-saghyz]